MELEKRLDSPRLVLVISGFCLIAAFLTLRVLSGGFVYGLAHEMRPISFFLFTYIISWISFGVAVWAATRVSGRFSIGYILIIAGILRLLMLGSNPILEHDYYRYTWEGHLLKNGIHPFRSAPEDVSLHELSIPADQLPGATVVYERTAFKSIKTIYPHMAQFVFWQNAWLNGWDKWGFQRTLLIYDLLLLIAVGVMLRQLNLPMGLLLVYAWCPLVLKEGLNSMHIDLVCAFFIVLFILAMRRQYVVWAMVALLCAAWVKITPLLLFPIYIVYVWRQGKRREVLVGTAVVAVLGLFSIWMLYWGAKEPFVGLESFQANWQTNSSLVRMWELILTRFGKAGALSIGKTLLLAMSIGFVLWRAWRVQIFEDVIAASGDSIFFLFLCSPVGNPWYLLWLIPFYVIDRRPHWLTLMIMTSLYYWSFWLSYHGYSAQDRRYDWLMCMQYVPVFFVAIILAIRKQSLESSRKTCRNR